MQYNGMFKIKIKHKTLSYLFWRLLTVISDKVNGRYLSTWFISQLLCLCAISINISEHWMWLSIEACEVQNDQIWLFTQNFSCSSVLFDKQWWLCSSISPTVLCYRNTWLCDCVAHWTSLGHLEQVFDYALVWNVQILVVYEYEVCMDW